MLQLPRTLLLAATLLLSLAVPSVAQTWTVQSIDREYEDGTGRGFCVLRSSEGLVISVSGYENANYIGFAGRPASLMGMPRLPYGPVLLTQTHVQVDGGYSATLDSTAHYVPKPDSGGSLVDLYAYYPRTGENLLGYMQKGSTLNFRVGEGFGVDNERNGSFSDPVSFSLAGSAAAIAEAIECANEPPSVRTAFDGEAFAAAIDAEIVANAALAGQDCRLSQGIWRSGSLTDSRLFYLDDNGETGGHNVYFERWIDNKVVARMYGDLVLGAYSAGVSILDEYHPYDLDKGYAQIDAEDRIASATVEFSYDTGRDTPDKLTFVDLDRLLSGKGSGHVDFYGDVEDPENVFAGPNEFSFFGCRTEPVKLEPPPLSRS